MGSGALAEDCSLSIMASKAHLTNPTEYEMIFLINHPQPFPPSPDLRASSCLLRWSSSSLQDAGCAAEPCVSGVHAQPCAGVRVHAPHDTASTSKGCGEAAGS